MPDTPEKLAQLSQSRKAPGIPTSQGVKPQEYPSRQQRPWSSQKTLMVVIGSFVVAIVFLSIVGVAFLAYGIFKAKQIVATLGIPSVENISSVSSDNEEAKKTAEEMFSQHWTKTGDYWTTISEELAGMNATPTGKTKILQASGVTINVTEDQLNDADKLNGIEFKGTVVFFAKAERVATLEDRKWGEWFPNNQPWGISGWIELNKINGKWTFVFLPPDIKACKKN